MSGCGEASPGLYNPPYPEDGPAPHTALERGLGYLVGDWEGVTAPRGSRVSLAGLFDL